MIQPCWPNLFWFVFLLFLPHYNILFQVHSQPSSHCLDLILQCIVSTNPLFWYTPWIYCKIPERSIWIEWEILSSAELGEKIGFLCRYRILSIFKLTIVSATSRSGSGSNISRALSKAGFPIGMSCFSIYWLDSYRTDLSSSLGPKVLHSTFEPI